MYDNQVLSSYYELMKEPYKWRKYGSLRESDSANNNLKDCIQQHCDFDLYTSAFFDIKSSSYKESHVFDVAWEYFAEKIVIDDLFKKYELKIDNNNCTTENTGSKSRIRNGSTSPTNINKQNKEFYNALKRITPSFVDSMKLQEFEDGEGNEITRQVEGFIKENSFVTYNWFSYIFSSFQNDPSVITPLLRIICMTVADGEEDCLIPIVIAGLSNPSSDSQEAAIMVIENWRTKNCYDALVNAIPYFNSEWMKSYGTAVLEELRKELEIC